MHRTLRFCLIVLAAALLAAPASARPAKRRPDRYVLDSVGVYGTNKLLPDHILKKFGETLKKYFRKKGYKKSGSAAREAGKLRAAIVAGVKKAGDFGWVEMNEELVRRDGRVRHILVMFEIIEKKDMATRFPFRTPPTAAVPDNSGLLAEYAKYDQTGLDLAREGTISYDRQECPAFFCTWGTAGDRFLMEVERFEQDAPSYKDLFSRIIQEEKDPQQRAYAVLLLSYLGDGAEVSNLISTGLTDPDDQVRDAVMRVYNDMAIYHHDVPLPVHQIARLLDYPYAQDRERALALMLAIADNKDYRSFLMDTASDQILRLLRSKHPNNHRMAHTVLTMLSNQEFPATDFEKWEQWVWKTRRAEREAREKGE